MSLVEIARFTDVYEADLAAAFLASHDIEVSVTERFQTTVDPLMQRALGIRLMGHSEDREKALDLLHRAAGGEFVEASDDEPIPYDKARWAGWGIALLGFMAAGYPATSLPRRLRPIQIAGMAILGLAFALIVGMWLFSL
ncbi:MULTISPECIES: hypothetical protein [unclassified Brevundimonas]|uniref:hypothetical protein n=1 Tax=unclassified Brevundimonas TaxID=2622653 RepID=UPI0025BC6B25|nr:MULTISPECIES: hypothetical protein [unclassified Brevundimonas]